MFRDLTAYYHQTLMNTTDGEQLLDWRGISQETASLFKIGYSPYDDADIVDHMEDQQDKLIEEKIFYEVNNQVHDNMRGRLIFPIENEKGDPVAFGGRNVTDMDKVKYMNTADNDYFKKSQTLYGLPQAKKTIKKRNYIVLMEGYMDVIQAHQNNIRNAVSALGTNLSEDQAALVKKYTPNVVIAFDNDGAGSQATIESAKLLQSYGCKVLISYMGADNGGYDPDDYIQEFGGVSFQKNVIAKAYPVIDFFMKNLAGEYDLSMADDRFDFMEEVLNFLRSSDNQKQYNKVMQTLEENFNISSETLRSVI